MKRFAQYIAIAAIAGVLLLSAGGWLVNRWLQSPAFRSAFEQELSRALRMPVKTDNFTFSVWNGLAVHGLTVTGADGKAFEVGRVAASHRLSSLLRGRFTIGEVRIEQPHLRLVEDASGNWRLPRNEPAHPPQPTVATPVLAAQPPAPAAPTSPAVPAAPAPNKATKSPVAIACIVLSGGTIELLDKARAPFATLTGIDATLHDAGGENFTGNFVIGRASLQGWLALNKFTGVMNRAGRTVQFRQLSASSGGGTLTGDVAWTEGATGTAGVKFDGIDIARTAQEAGAANPRVGGILNGTVQIAGLGADKNGITGKGTLNLKGGNCREIELLRQIGEVLQIAAIASFEIADVTADFTVAQSQVVLAPANVSAPPVGVTLTGPVAFDGAINLSAILHAPTDFVARHGLVASQFSPPDTNNRRGINFNITGTLGKPRQNLAERLTGTKDRKQQRIIAAEAIISALMQKNKPKPAQPAATAQPSVAQP